MSYVEKIRIAQRLLVEHNIPMWLIYSDNSCKDHCFDLLGGKADVSSYMLLTSTDKRLIVHNLDAKNQADCWKDDMLVFSNGGSEELLAGAIHDLGFSGKFATNYSARCFKTTDRLPAGRRDYIEKIVINYFPSELGIDFNDRNSIARALIRMRDINVSAEDVLLQLYDRKSSTEVERLRFAAERTNQVLEEAFSHVRPGMQDYELMNLVERVRKDTFVNVNREGLVSEELAWESELCPIILTGDSFVDGGHSRCSGQIIEEGSTLYFDYGVKHKYRDGIIVCSDIQRMGYVLREGEDGPNSEVQELFDVIYKSITAGAEAAQIGVNGIDVDRAVRSIVNAAGFNYDHDTGHPIGHDAHSPGVPFRNKDEGLFVQPGGVYTLEPRIPVRNGCSIEEMIHVKPEGGVEFLSPRQERFYLVRK